MSSAEMVQQQRLGHYLNTSAGALYLFETLISLAQEIDAIWCQRWSAITWVYAFTRYSTVVSSILPLISPGNKDMCKVIVRLGGALQLAQYLAFAAFSALRVYALSGGRYLVAGLVFALEATSVAANTYNSVTGLAVVYQDGVCAPSPTLSEGRILLLSLLVSIPVVLGDVLVLIVTWLRTARVYRRAQESGMKSPIAGLLLRDGTVWFIAFLAINVADMIQVNSPKPIMAALSNAQPFFEVFLPLMVCRFILHLRKPKRAASESLWASGNQSFSMRFLGQVRNPLQGGQADGEDSECVDARDIESLDNDSGTICYEGVRWARPHGHYSSPESVSDQ